ncbi:MAG TPA: uroporphyrinogen-III synthase, partial [Gammaproteobacteria bacterium]|nr:uroporphyrinogen-III synthase [Gammaproteobacteria bacterium]
ATPTLAEGLQARGITVESRVCYQRKNIAQDVTWIKKALAAGDIHYVLVSSGASLKHLVALLTVNLLNPCTLVVVSRRLEKLARSLGFSGDIIIAQGADDAAMIEAIKP